MLTCLIDTAATTTQLATAASKIPGAAAGLPTPPKDYKDIKGILANSGYFDSELKKHCGGEIGNEDCFRYFRGPIDDERLSVCC